MKSIDRRETPAQLLTLIKCRYNFLTLLNKEPHTKLVIEDTLNVSRSTVDRAFRELEAANLIQRTEDGYRTTMYGLALTAVYDSFLDHFDHVSRAKTLLAELSPDISFNIGMIFDAEICVAEEPALHAPAFRVAELVDKATDLQGLVYAHTSPKALDHFRQQVHNGMPAEIVFRQKMYENFEAAHPTVVDTLVSSDNCIAFVASEVPFGLLLLTLDGTEHVCLIVYDTDQTLKGIIVNDTAEAVTWGTHLFEQYRARATPVLQE